MSAVIFFNTDSPLDRLLSGRPTVDLQRKIEAVAKQEKIEAPPVAWENLSVIATFYRQVCNCCSKELVTFGSVSKERKETTNTGEVIKLSPLDPVTFMGQPDRIEIRDIPVPFCHSCAIAGGNEA